MLCILLLKIKNNTVVNVAVNNPIVIKVAVNSSFINRNPIIREINDKTKKI